MGIGSGSFVSIFNVNADVDSPINYSFPFFLYDGLIIFMLSWLNQWTVDKRVLFDSGTIPV